jgi:hypothetical protein
MRMWLAVVAAVCACRGKPQTLYPAGDTRDEGHGLLAQASTQFMTDEETEGLADDNRRRAYGGSAYGGAAYGGSGYAGYVVPAWPVTAPNRTPRYNQVQGLSGAIEGTIALRGAKLKAACGDVEPARAALVYIEKVQIGRSLLNDGRPTSVGGTLVKRGCGLAPAVQIVTPLPAALAIQGDAKPAKLRIGAKLLELQAGGRTAMQLTAGVTKVDVEGGGAAWIVALDTPYYAITDDRGRFRIDELAPGTYEVIVWQAPAGKLVNGAVTYGEPIVSKRTVRVENRRAARLDVR